MKVTLSILIDYPHVVIVTPDPAQEEGCDVYSGYCVSPPVLPQARA